MISHVVLFRPKATLSAEQRAALIDALRSAVTGIAEIKRTTIGKRILLDRPGYEKLMRVMMSSGSMQSPDPNTGMLTLFATSETKSQSALPL